MFAILVFGGTGFIGSALVKFLLLKNMIVIVYRHKNTGLLSGVNNENLIYVDSFKDAILDRYKIDTVYHLASAQTSQNSSYIDLYNGNVNTTLHILSLVKKVNAKHLIFTSTTTVFSELEERCVINEKLTPKPANYYGLTKYISESILEIECKKNNIKSTIVRLPSVFGVNSGGGIIQVLYEESINNTSIEVYGNGQRLRNVIYIDSVVDMLHLIMKNRRKLDKFEVFMAGSQDSIKLIDIAKKIVNLSGSKSKVMPINKYPLNDFNVDIDTKKSQEILGFKPLSIEEGLMKYIEKMKNEKI